MSYKLEGKDIVVSGFDGGIADSPYKGISDIRNVDLISIPEEASVAFKTTTTITQSPLATQAFTASSSSGLLLTWAGGTALADNTAVTVANSGGALPTGLAVDTAYYVINSTATTFKLALTAGGAAIAFTDAGTGTHTFSTINMGKPKFKSTASSTALGVLAYYYFLLDANGRAWYYYQQSQWVYMKNLGAGNENTAGVTENGNGLVFWKNYLLVFRWQNIAIIQVIDASGINTITELTTAGNWTVAWQSMIGPWSTSNYPTNVSHAAIAGPTDDVVYFCNTAFIGTIMQNAGTVFAPGTAATFTFNASALALPLAEIAQCLAQLGTNILAGGLYNIVYSWDRVSPGYLPIFISENLVAQIVTTNTTAYFFAGQRGRIFECNGSQAQLFKKVPDHLSNTVNPYYTWGGALTSRNQLYFGVQATDNARVAINQYGGLWAIDLDSKAIRLVNRLSYASYAGIASSLTTVLGPTTSDGFGLLIGWFTTVGGVDKGSSAPYSGGESYVDSDMMPLGTFLDPFTPTQVEWKTSVGIGANGTSESVALYYRTNLSDSFTLIGSTSSTTGQISDMYQVNFQKAQWVQLRAVLTSNATTPTYCRLTEFRIRDWPSGKTSQT